MDWSKFIILQVAALLLVGTCRAADFNSFVSFFVKDERATILSELHYSEPSEPTIILGEAAGEPNNLLIQVKNASTISTTPVSNGGTTTADNDAESTTVNYSDEPSKSTAAEDGTTVQNTEPTSEGNPSSTTENNICKDHDDECSASSECCAIPNMSCWRHPSLEHPMCKCDAYFQWDSQNWTCFPMSLSDQMMMAAVMAFSVAIIVALVAFCVHSCKNCGSYRDRIRYLRQDRRRRNDPSAARRYDNRDPLSRFTRDQHNLSVFVVRETKPDEEIKLPTYEEIENHQIIYANVIRISKTPGNVSVAPPDYASVNPVNGVNATEQPSNNNNNNSAEELSPAPDTTSTAVVNTGASE